MRRAPRAHGSASRPDRPDWTADARACRVVAAIKGFLALHHAVLERTNLALTLLVLGLGGLLVLDDLLFSLEQSLFFEGLGLTLCIADQGLSLCVCRLDLFVGLMKTTLLGGAHVGNGGDGT